MPAINVRLTDDQHEELRQAVFKRGRHWSIQKEIVDRLFRSATEHLKEVSQQPIQVLDAVATIEVGETAIGKIGRPCPREGMHHLNRMSKPCPNCGYPKGVSGD